MESYLNYLEKWLEEELNYRQADGFVVGVSGGIDSAVVVHLLARKFADKTIGLILPCKSNPSDQTDAELVLQDTGITYKTIDLTKTHDTLFPEITEFMTKRSLDEKRVIDGNMRARLRMTSLFSVAQSKNYLVVGTDNAIEWYTGYFTKFGDGGVDIAPLIHLTKTEVREAANILAVPEAIINKAPSAGLWDDQTDETEMGVTYETLEAFLAGNDVTKEAEKRINYWHERSHHKRDMPRMPKKINE